MSDERRRELARRSGGDEEAAARQLLERVRAGEVSEDRVFLAAWAGDAPSRLVMADNEILRDVVRASGNHQFRLDSTRGLILNEADKLLGWRVMLQYAHDCVQHAVVSRIPESWTGLLSAYRFVGAWLRNDARLMKEIASAAEYWTLSADEDADPFQMLEGLRLQALEESHRVLVNDDPQGGPAGDLYQVRSIARLTDSLLYRLSGRDRGGFYPVPTREIVDECLHSLQDVHEAFVAEGEWERLRLIGLLLKTDLKRNGKRRNADSNLRDLERRAYDSNEDFLRYSAARLRAGLGPVEVVLQPKDIYTEGGPTSMIRGVGYLVRPALRAGHIDGSRQTAMLYAAVQRPEGWSVVQLRRYEDEKWSASGSVTIADPSEETAMTTALEAATNLITAWSGQSDTKRNRSMKPTKQNPHFAIKQIEKALIQQFSIRALKALVTAFDEEERDPPLWVQVAAVLGTYDPQGRGVRSVAEAKRIAGYMQGDGWDGIDGVIPGEAFDLNVRPVMREIAKVARARGIRGANDASGQLAAVWVDMGRALDKLAVAYNPLTGDLVIEAPSELVPADGTIIALGTPLPQRRSASNPPKDEPLASAHNENTQAFMKAMSGLYDTMAESPGAGVRLEDAFKHLKRPGKYGKTHFEADLSATQTARPVPTDAKGRRLMLHPASLMNGKRDFHINSPGGGRLVVTFTMPKEARKNSPDVNVVKAFFRGQDAKSGAVVSKKVTIELGDIDCDDCNGAGVNEHGRKCPTCDGQKGFKDVTAEVGVLEVRKAPIAWRNDDTRFTLLPKKLVPLTAKKTYEELLEVLAPYKVGLTYARSADGERFDNEEDVR